MNTKLFLLIGMLFITNSLFAQYYNQYFDGADTSYYNSTIILIDSDSSNIWQVSRPQKGIFDSAATFPNVIITDTINFYPTNNVSRFIAKVYPWYYRGIFALQWKQKLDLDSDYDGGIIEYSNDYGDSWHNVFNNPYVYNFYGFQLTNQDTLITGEYAFSGTDSTWRDVWLCFESSWLEQFQDSVLFRFTLQSDSIDNFKEGWMIDNFIAHNTTVHTVNEVKLENYFNIYPNPTSDIIYIETQKIEDFHIIEQMEIINSIGQVIDKWKNIPTKFFINTQKYNNGYYYLKIKTNIKSETMPIVINRNSE